MNKQKISPTQQIHSLHLKNPLSTNAISLLVYVPFSPASVCKYWTYVTDVGSQPSQISKKERFTNIVNNYKPLIIFAKRFILDVWQGSEYPSGVVVYIELLGQLQTFYFIFYDKISQVQKSTKKH